MLELPFFRISGASKQLHLFRTGSPHNPKGRELLWNRSAELEKLRRLTLGDRTETEALASVGSDLPLELRLWGAEIASLAALRKEPPYERLERLVLLRSETAETERVASLLTHLVRERFGWECEVRTIPGLSDLRPGVFRTIGLRELVRTLAETVRTYGIQACVFDATAGFKAQVGFMILMGQLLGIPVVYRFETFAEVIEFPPLPVSLDWALLERFRDALQREVLTAEEFLQLFGPRLSEGNPDLDRLRSAWLQDPEDHTYRISAFGLLLREAMVARPAEPGAH